MGEKKRMEMTTSARISPLWQAVGANPQRLPAPVSPGEAWQLVTSYTDADRIYWVWQREDDDSELLTQ